MKSSGGRGKPQAAPRRRRRLPRRIKRGALWLLLAITAAGGYGAIIASRMPAGQAAFADATNRVISATALFGLVVTDIQVEGRETTDVTTVMAALSAARGAPILAISPARAKEQLEALPWVRSATIERRLPGTLFVKLVERHPLALWQHDRVQQLIDRDGTVIPVDDLSRFAHLPIVVGDDAAPNAARLIDMLAGQSELAARVTAAVRVGGRRWNLRIDDAIDVMLPEDSPESAWSRLAELERTSLLLKRDVQTVDLRLPDRLVLRVNAPPTPPPAATGKKTGKSA